MSDILPYVLGVLLGSVGGFFLAHACARPAIGDLPSCEANVRECLDIVEKSQANFRECHAAATDLMVAARTCNDSLRAAHGLEVAK